MTPPLSMSASPRLTSGVPVDGVGAGPVLSALSFMAAMLPREVDYLEVQFRAVPLDHSRAGVRTTRPREATAVQIERGRPVPVQIVEDIRGRITDSRLAPGDPLPSTRVLTRQLGMIEIGRASCRERV